MTKRVPDFTDEHRAALTAYAKQDMLREGKFNEHMIKLSDIWEVRAEGELIGVYGIYRPNVVVAPSFWFLLCEGFKLPHVRAFRYFVQSFRDGLESLWTSVEADFTAGQRFAEVCGFQPTGAEYEVEGVRYLKYRINYQ